MVSNWVTCVHGHTYVRGAYMFEAHACEQIIGEIYS